MFTCQYLSGSLRRMSDLIGLAALFAACGCAGAPLSVLRDPNFFPLAVWLQDPANASRYRAVGINTYVGLWQGPTEKQLAGLKSAGMYLVCEQTEVALRHLDEPTIVGWMHGDEPDNAQALPDGKGWGPPVEPAKIKSDYEKLRQKDPSRPVLLNLGQGVAWDAWYGRGSRSHHPEDYPDYLQGCDIVSFDIYPAVHDHPDVAGKLWLVPFGVARLVKWSNPKQTVWNCLECTRISNPNRKPTPQEVRCEAWMAIIHGSQGFIYFVHQFKPTFREAALLDDAEMLETVTILNRQISSLAPVIHSPTLTNRVSARALNPAVPIATMLKSLGNTNYLFAVTMRSGNTKAEFTVPGLKDNVPIEVLGENRKLVSRGDGFLDEFSEWGVHLYRYSP